MSQNRLILKRRRSLLGGMLVVFLMLGAACGPTIASQPNTPVAATETVIQTDDTPNDNTADVVLLWAGSVLPSGEKGEGCTSLTITIAGQAKVGPCDGEQQEVEFMPNLGREWSDIVARFAPFETEMPNERIVFNGRGDLAGSVWQRAVTAWARLAAAELASGKISATGPTVLAWNLGELPDQPGICQRLIVLVYGYATAATTPCAGGNTIDSVSGWIDPADWEQFDAWLYASAPVYQNDNYLDGRGSAEMSEADVAALAAWARAVYDKINLLFGVVGGNAAG